MTTTATLDQIGATAFEQGIAAPHEFACKINEPVFKIRELSKMGFGHPQTIREWLHEDGVPFEVVDGRGTIGVRESDLHLLRKPSRRRRSQAELVAGASAITDITSLAILAAQMVASWPRLSTERKAELGRLLAVA